MGRWEQLRAGVSRAYRAGRGSIRPPLVRDLGGEPMELEAAPEADQLGHEPAPATPPPVDEAVPRGLRIAAAWSWRLIVVGAVAWVLLWIVDRFLILVAPLMIGLLLAGLLAPALRLTLRLRLNRSLATFLVLVAGLAAVSATITLAVNQVLQSQDELVASAEQGVADIQDWLRTGPLNMSEADLQELTDQGSAWVEENTESLVEQGLSAVTGTVQFLTGLVLTLVVTFFFLRDGRRIWTFLVGMLPHRARAPMRYAGDGAWRSLTGYVRATVLVAFIDAVGIGVGLWILRVPLELPLAALVFLGAFVPIVGAFVSGTVAVLVALVDAPQPGILDGGGVVKALMVLGLVLLVQQIEGNVLHPVIMSRAVSIHPLAVIVAITSGVILAGVIGALVAVPVVAVLNAVVRRLHEYHRPRLAHPGPPLPEDDGARPVGT